MEAYNPGLHNLALPQSTARLLEGGTWKQQRVVVIVPTAKEIPVRISVAHRNLMFPPNQANYWLVAEGDEVGIAYSKVIEAILKDPVLSAWEYLLTVEHDNSPPPDGLVKLIKRMEANPQFACIGGLYWTKGEAGVPQIWGDARDPVLNFRPQVPVAGQLVECNGTGMGFNLFRLGMFKDERLRKPWFKTVCSKEEGVGTQDLYFWADARKLGYRCAVDCDVKVGHLEVRKLPGGARQEIMW